MNMAPCQGRSGSENCSTANAAAARMSTAMAKASFPVSTSPMIPNLVPLSYPSCCR